MRRAAHVDGNHRNIVEALRKVGASVQSLANVGSGVPDLLVGYHGHTHLFEVKDPSQPPNKRRLTTCQAEWIARWRGRPVDVVTSADEALLLIAAWRPEWTR